MWPVMNSNMDGDPSGLNGVTIVGIKDAKSEHSII